MTLWSVGETQVFGSLIWLNGSPVLTLFLEVDEALGSDFDKAKIPALELTKPPIQATITGTVPKYGTVTLERCARYNVSTNQNTRTGKSIYELDFIPTAVWVGAPKDVVEGKVVRAVALDTRLAGFFGSPGLQIYKRFDPEATALFEAMGQPESIWAVHGLPEHRIQLGETGWQLGVYTEAMESTSSTEGHALRSTISLAINSTGATTIEAAENALARLEEIISVFSIEPFTFQTKEYKTDEFASIILAWRLGEDHNLFRPPMRHQILVDLSDSNTLKTVCGQWFIATETVSLSRWLFARALRETEDGLARFIVVAQAFEVLGRELGPHESMSRDRLNEADELVRQALSGKFEDAFIERTVNLIRSSNKSSFRDIVHHMITQAVESLKLGDAGDLAAFSRVVSETRNAVIHMPDDDKGKLTAAFNRVNKLSLQLCFWYSVCQAYYIGVSIPNIREFLFNNRNARHGLPNEILEG
jgi:ApeA N-terminal domain 1